MYLKFVLFLFLSTIYVGVAFHLFAVCTILLPSKWFSSSGVEREKQDADASTPGPGQLWAKMDFWWEANATKIQ